jgi:hypothetical protein
MFDPFDDRHRDKQKRRKSSEVAFEKRTWDERVANHFKRSMEELGWPDYVRSADIWDCVERSEDSNLDRSGLIRKAASSMESLGYERMTNPKCVSGMWHFGRSVCVVYKRKGLPLLDKWDGWRIFSR